MEPRESERLPSAFLRRPAAGARPQPRRDRAFAQWARANPKAAAFFEDGYVSEGLSAAGDIPLDALRAVARSYLDVEWLHPAAAAYTAAGDCDAVVDIAGRFLDLGLFDEAWFTLQQASLDLTAGLIDRYTDACRLHRWAMDVRARTTASL